MEFELPGFRFHPTEEELLEFYLKKTVLGKNLHVDVIGFLNIYLHDPWDLPGLAKIGEREWYFFVPRERRDCHGGRPTRTTKNGYWKATGSDRSIRCLTDQKKLLGTRKTLVFYQGRAPRGCRTDWVMNEYRLPSTSGGSCSLPMDDLVLCKIYRKATSIKVLEQRAAAEEKIAASARISSYNATSSSYSCPLSQETTLSFYDHDQKNLSEFLFLQDIVNLEVEQPKLEVVEYQDHQEEGFMHWVPDV